MIRMSTLRAINHPLGESHVLPSVAELIDGIASEMESRRPANWASIAREQWNRCPVPLVVLSNPWEWPHESGDVGIAPTGGHNLNAEIADCKCANVQLETKLDVAWETP